MRTIYVNIEDGRSWSTSQDAWGGFVCPVEVADDFTGGAMSYDAAANSWTPDPEYTPTQQDITNAATGDRDRLVAEANAIIYDWAVDATTGDITDADLASLKVWRAYIKKLKALDLDDAPDIEWPEKPE